MPRKSDGLVAVTLRFPEDMRSVLEQTAKERNASLNSELVTRLDRTLTEDTVLGGSMTSSMLRGFAAEIRLAEDATGKSWCEDVETWAAAQYLIEARVRSLRPPLVNAAEVEKTAKRYSSAREQLDAVITMLRARGVVDDKHRVARALLSGVASRALSPLETVTNLIEKKVAEADGPTDQSFIQGTVAEYLASADALGIDWAREQLGDAYNAEIRVALFLEKFETHIDPSPGAAGWEAADGSAASDDEQRTVRALLRQVAILKEEELAAKVELRSARRSDDQEVFIGRTRAARIRGDLRPGEMTQSSLHADGA